MNKKLLSILLSLAMVVSMLQLATFLSFADEWTATGVAYIDEDGNRTGLSTLGLAKLSMRQSRDEAWIYCKPRDTLFIGFSEDDVRLEERADISLGYEPVDIKGLVTYEWAELYTENRTLKEEPLSFTGNYIPIRVTKNNAYHRYVCYPCYKGKRYNLRFIYTIAASLSIHRFNLSAPHSVKKNTECDIRADVVSDYPDVNVTCNWYTVDTTQPKYVGEGEERHINSERYTPISGESGTTLHVSIGDKHKYTYACQAVADYGDFDSGVSEIKEVTIYTHDYEIYTVAFDTQNIGTSVKSAFAVEGGKVNEPEAPLAEDYVFDGWFKEPECINAWNFNTDVVTGNMTLYGKWIPKTIPYEKTPVELVSATASGDKVIKLSWTKVDGATKYFIYGNKCGWDNECKLLATTTSKRTYTVKKINGKKLVPHKSYKFYVVAKTANGKVRSKTIHFIAGNTKVKYANVKTLKVNPTSLELGVGEFSALEAKYTMYQGKKHPNSTHGKALRYISDCPEVASVSADGVVIGRAHGTATIYVQDIGGKYYKVKVTVA